MKNVIPNTIATVMAWLNNGVIPMSVLAKDIVQCPEDKMWVSHEGEVVILTKEIDKKITIPNFYEDECVINRDKEYKVILSHLDIKNIGLSSLNYKSYNKSIPDILVNKFMSRNKNINMLVVVGEDTIMIKRVIER